MIQRIQTVWLLLAIALCVAFHFLHPHDDSSIHLAPHVLNIGVALIALISIFLFAKRKIQAMTVVGALVLSLGMMGIMVLEIVKGSMHPSMACTPGIALMVFLAWKGIQKDEALIKSLDRMR